MRILVCIKQVPGTTTVAIDEKTGVLIRDGVASKMNPFDLFALETAIRIREAKGGTVSVLTMGPPQAMAILQEAIAMGADDACLLTDRQFAGSDVIATSYALTQGIRQMAPFDLLVFGKQTTDGDTAQVGAEVAEFLDWPHAANVSRIDEITDLEIRIMVNLEKVIQIQKIQLPCLIMVEKDLCMPRLPSYKRLKQARQQQIRVLTLKDFANQDPKHYGLAGSPTQVEKIFPPTHTTEKAIITGSADHISEQLFQLLSSHKMI